MKSDSQINGLLSPFLQRQRFRAARPFLKGRSFIDIGCSNGEILRHIPRDADYIGIEGNRRYFENARRLHPERRFLKSYLDVRTARELRLPRSDVIIALAVIEHMDDPGAVLPLMRGWLNPGGRVVITTPTRASERVLSVGSRIGLFMSEMHEHKRCFSRSELLSMTRESGYRVAFHGTFELGLNHLLVLEPR